MADTRTRPGNGSPTPTPTPAEQHHRNLRAVNQNLRDVIESLRVARERHANQAVNHPPTPDAGGQADHLEVKRLRGELAQALECFDHARQQEERVRERLGEIEAEHRRLCDDLVAEAEHSASLGALYVAVDRLHGTLDRGAFLDSIQEIVINLVGSEELAVYELATGSSELVLARGFGVAGTRPERIRVGDGTIGCVAETGHEFVAGRDAASDDATLTACIPLRVAGRTTGVIAIWRLLDHKPLLSDVDGTMFQLLAVHAGAALYAASLHARATGAA
jgi:GAF domain